MQEVHNFYNETGATITATTTRRHIIPLNSAYAWVKSVYIHISTGDTIASASLITLRDNHKIFANSLRSEIFETKKRNGGKHLFAMPTLNNKLFFDVAYLSNPNWSNGALGYQIILEYTNVKPLYYDTYEAISHTFNYSAGNNLISFDYIVNQSFDAVTGFAVANYHVKITKLDGSILYDFGQSSLIYRDYSDSQFINISINPALKYKAIIQAYAIGSGTDTLRTYLRYKKAIA